MAESILKKRIGIEKEIDEFLDQVSEAGLSVQERDGRLSEGEHSEAFVQALTSIRNTEHKGDALRRSIEQDLYQKTLIPESRGDVMELLEDMDALLDRFTGLIWQFDIERPDICVNVSRGLQGTPAAIPSRPSRRMSGPAALFSRRSMRWPIISIRCLLGEGIGQGLDPDSAGDLRPSGSPAEPQDASALFREAGGPDRR